MRLLLKHKKDHGRMLHGSTKPEPHIQGNMTNHCWRYVAQIQDNQAEAAAVQNQIRSAQCLIDVPAANPHQLT